MNKSPSRQFAFGLVVSLVFCGVSSAANTALPILQRFNIIAGNYTAGNETEGSALVYGNYYAGGSSRFGFNDGRADNDAEYMLWLNNGVANGSTTTLLSGSLISRTAVNPAQFNLNGNSPGEPVRTTGETAWAASLAAEVGLNSTDEVVATLSDASAQWAALPANSTATNLNNGALTLSATPTNIDGHQVAIFNVTSADVSGATLGRIDLFLNGADTVLVNVSGSSVVVGANFAGQFVNNESKVLFNFHQATSVSVNTNMRAGVLAPLAVVAQNGSNIDGSVVAASFTQNAEVHDERFLGYLPYEAVPEPSVIGLLLLGAAGVLRRRR